MSAADKIGVASFKISAPSLGGRNVSSIEVEPSMMSPTAAIVSASSFVALTGVGVGTSAAEPVFSSELTVFGAHESEIRQPIVKANISNEFRGFDIISKNSTG